LRIVDTLEPSEERARGKSERGRSSSSDRENTTSTKNGRVFLEQDRHGKREREIKLELL